MYFPENPIPRTPGVILSTCPKILLAQTRNYLCGFPQQEFVNHGLQAGRGSGSRFFLPRYAASPSLCLPPM